jgi:hypothetical protein
MAWNISKAKRQALVKLQLRDKNGKFIEMGGGVKWYSSRLKKVVAGTVVGTKGENALVRLNKENPTHEPALVSVPAAGITAIENKASLSPKGAPSADTTPEFEKPEAVADVKADPNAEADSDHESQLKGPQHLAANYGVTETSDGHTYITRNDGESIYSPARGLKVGDELIAPAGADPTKPFSIGRGWATKGTERLNKEGEGPVIGKVIAVSENRYAVVQMAGGHTIADRRNPDEQTDTVTVGLSNQVILATMGLKDALGDRVSSQKYADRPSDEDREVSPTAPEAQSDHVGREVPEDQLGTDGQQAPATDRAQVMRDMPVGGRSQTEDGSQVFEKHGDNQWSLASGNGELLDDNSTLNMVKAGEDNGHKYQAYVPDDASAPESGEKKITDVSAEEMAQMPKGTVLRDPEGKLAYFVKQDGDNWAHHLSNGDESGNVSSSAAVKNSDTFAKHTFAEPGTVPNQNDSSANQNDSSDPSDSPDSTESSDAPESPESAPDQSDAPEDQPSTESPAEQAPEAAEEAPPTEAPVEDAPEESAGAKATPVNDIVDGLAELEQATEDIEDSGMDDGEAEDVLNGASFDITAADGSRQTVTAEKDENGDWNYVVSDENGAEVASHIIGSDDNRVLAERIANPDSVAKKEDTPAAEATPEAAPESTPEAPEAESYNEKGLTEKEQRELDSYTRLASRSYEQFKDEEGDRYKALADELLARGEERKSSAPAEQAETAPESAPQADQAPEATPEAAKPAEDAPEAPQAPKANVSLSDLEAQAKADGDTVLYHGGLPDGTTLDDIDLNRNGTQQNRRGRSYGGFYLTDESSKDWSNSYASQRNGVMHGFAIDKNARIDDRGDQQIDRLSAEDRAEAAKTADVIKGKDLLGRTQYVLLNKDVVKGVGETNINNDKSSENSAPTPSLVEPDAAPNEADKAPVNGEEGFVPIDGRGLKDSKGSKEASADSAPAANGPFGISYEMRRDGLDHAVPSNPEAMTDEENAEFERQDIALAWAQHDNRRGAETNARRALADLERRVQSRLDAESLNRQRDIQNGNLPGSSNDRNESSSDNNEASPEAKNTTPDHNESETPVEAPATEAPEAAPVVDANANEDGLLPNEAARLADLENRQAAAFRGESNEDPASFDAEISELIRHGRLRGRGRDVGPFVARNPAPDAPAQDSQDSPEPAVPEAPAAETPVAPEAPAAEAPRARRPRGGEAVPVADADGNMITRGDKIGHPTLGPVEIINTIPGSGRVEFIDPTTGRKKSVKAARVRKIDPNAEQAAPEEQPTTAEPGERFVDAATGKQGFGDKNGNRVLVGDRVKDANGNTGTVKSVYTAASGGAWIPVQWDSDGKTRRVMGNMLEKDNSSAPEATPEAAPSEPLEVARPSASPAPAPEAVPEPAPAPAEEPFEPVLPSATPAPAPAPEAAPEEETHEAATARRQAMVDSTPVNSMIASQDGTQKFYKISDSQWQFNEGNILPPTAVVNMVALGERRGQSYDIAEGRPAQTNLPESATPAVDAPQAPADTEIAPAERERRISMLRRLPAGTTIKPRSGEYTLTKTGSDEWSSTVDDGVYDTEDIYGIVDSGRRGGLLYEVTRPNSGQPAPTSTPEPEIPLEADSLVPPTVASRLEAFRRAPIGTTVTSPGGTSTYTKQGPDEWTNPDISGATIKNSTLAIATDSDNGHWVFNKTGPAEPEGTNITAMTATDRLAAFRQAPIGSKLVSTGGKVITKTEDRKWVSDNGTEYTPADLVFVTDPRQADTVGPFGLVLPETAAPADVSTTGGSLPTIRAERQEALSRLPIGAKVTVRHYTFTKRGENAWEEAEDGDNTVYTDNDVSWSGSQAAPGVVTLPEPKPIPQDIASRIRVSEESPIGTIVTSSTGESYTKISDAQWADTATGNYKYGVGEFASKIKNNPYTGDYFVTGFDVPEPVREPFAGGVLSPDGDEMERQIQSLPVGATVTGGRNNTTFVRREPDVWSSEQNPEEYYNDADLAWRLGLSYGINTPVAELPDTGPADEATAKPVIYDTLPKGSFVPNAAGSKSGVKKVGEDKWEMIKDGQPTGRFVNDEAAAVLQELVGTEVYDPRFGNNVGMYAEDLKLPGGKSLGKYLEEGGTYGRLTRAQKAAIEAGYRKFIDNLNTQLPEGFRAELQYVSFGSNSMETSVEFYQGNRALGPATRRFSTSTDSRTNRKVSSVDHAFWALSNDVQGSGLSAAFLKASKQMYRQMGLDRITVHADISVGSYAWARSGFDFRSPHYMDSAMSAWDGAWGTPPRGREAEWEEGKRQFRALRARATHANFMAGTHPAAIDFANIGRPEDGNTGADATWFGKQMLSNTHWYGDLILNPAPTAGTVAPSV